MEKIVDKKAWLAKFRETMEELDRIKARELRAMTDEEAVRIIMSLNTAEEPWRERPEWSGLVEQQRIFMRARKK